MFLPRQEYAYMYNQKVLNRANIQKTKYFFLSKLYNSSSQLKKIPNTLCVTDLEIYAATDNENDQR